MLKLLIGKFVKKHGIIPMLIKVGDIAVKATRSKRDDKEWAKIKKVVSSL